MGTPDGGTAEDGARAPRPGKAATAAAGRLPPAIRDAIASLVEYNWADEEADYTACGPAGNSRRGHIRLDIALLSHWLGHRDDKAGTGPATLKAAAAELKTKTDGIADDLPRHPETGTCPRAALEDACRSLESLAEKTAALTGKEDPQSARRLLRIASEAGDSAAIAAAGLGSHAALRPLKDGIVFVQRAVQAHEDRVPAGIAEAISKFRGCMTNGYTSETVNRVLGAIGDAAGLNLACVWDIHDDAGTGGNAGFYVVDDNGQIRETGQSLRRWLSGRPGDPDAAASPGNPATWTGPPAGFTASDLPYHDGFCNYAKQDTAAPGERAADDAEEHRAAGPEPEFRRGPRPSSGTRRQDRGQPPRPNRTAPGDGRNPAAR